MDCFYGLVQCQKAFSLISSWDQCQRSSPFWISGTLQAEFKPVQNLSSGSVEWSCVVVITTTPRCNKLTIKIWKVSLLNHCFISILFDTLVYQVQTSGFSPKVLPAIILTFMITIFILIQNSLTMVFYTTMLSEHKQVHPTSILAWQWRTCRFAKNNLPSLQVPHAIYLMYIMYVSAYKYCQFLFSCSIWRCTILVCYPVVTCIFNLCLVIWGAF